MQIPAFTIPLVGDPANTNSVVNALNSRAVVIPQVATVQFPVTFFVGGTSAGTMINDFSNIVTAEFVLRKQSTTSDPGAGDLVFVQVIAVANLNTTLTYTQFQTGTVGHALFTMSSTDTNLPPGNYYLAFGVTTTNAGNVPMGFSTTVTIVDRGIFNGGTPVPPTAISYTEQQSDARYALVSAVGAFAAAINFAPIQPFGLFLQYGGRLVRISGGYDGITLALSGIGMTYVSPVEVVAWLTEAVYFIMPNLGSAPLTIDLSNNALTNTGDILSAIAAVLASPPFNNFGGGFTLLVNGGTNAAPPPGTAGVAGLLTFDCSTPNFSVGPCYGTPAEVQIDPSIPFSSSSLDAGNYRLIIGTQDNPTPAAIAAELLSGAITGATLPQLASCGSWVDNGDGTITVTSQPGSDNLPLQNTGGVGNAGNEATPNAAITAINAYNSSSVTTN